LSAYNKTGPHCTTTTTTTMTTTSLLYNAVASL
jgi:hypothetical protein